MSSRCLGFFAFSSFVGNSLCCILRKMSGSFAHVSLLRFVFSLAIVCAGSGVLVVFVNFVVYGSGLY